MIRRVLVMTLAATAIINAQPPSAPAPQKPGMPGVQFPMSALPPDAQYAIGGGPDWLAVGDDMVWTNARKQDFVARMDPKTSNVVARVSMPKPCSGLIIGAGSLWAPSCSENALYRIDLATNKVIAKVAVGPANGEGGIAFGAGSVWMPSDPKGVVVKRIDPATNSVVAEVPLPPGSFTAIYGFGLVWVSSTEKNLVSVISPVSNNVIAEIPVDAAPRFMAVGEGYVWTLNQTKGTVSKIDPYLKKSVATIEVGVPGPGGEIAAGEGSVWVTADTIPVSRIDPLQNKVIQQFTGAGGDAIEVGHGSVWLSNGRSQSVWRFLPSKVTTVAATTWLNRALPADLDGDGKPDLLIEDLMVRFVGEPTRFRMKVLDDKLGDSFVLKATLAGKDVSTDFVKEGDEWAATVIPGPERGYIRYSVCVKGGKCSEEDAVGLSVTPLPYAKQKLKLVPENFLVPVVPKIGDFVWVYHDPTVMSADMKMMHSLPKPADPILSEEYGSLKRHEWELVRNIAFSWAVCTPDQSEELAFVQIFPSPKQGYDAMVRMVVTNHGIEAGLDKVIEAPVKEWIKTQWPFQKVGYPGRDIPTETWNALPNISE
jgi:virginiamycin B lyase